MPPETRPNTISLAEDQLPPSRPVAQGGADESMFSLRLVWQFTLYIAGGSPHSMVALDNLNTLCRKHLADRHHIEIVDVLLHPERALADGVMLTPTLIRCLPVPVRIIIGTLADTRAVLQTLGVVATAP